jgi:Glycosyl transferase family 2
MTPPAELACAVLSLAGDSRLVGAVRSLRAQSEAVEVVVVNSGGGDPAASLRAAGLEVPVVDHPSRLFPGEARNLGVDATEAPYLAFLAADCRAQPGWAAGRLAAHRSGAAAVASVITATSLTRRSESASLLLVFGRRLTSTPPHWRRHYSLSYERGLFERHGRFREDLRTGEDTDFNDRFCQEEEVAWAPTVVTAHAFPATPGALLSDQYRRGQLRALAERELGRISAPGIAAQSLAFLVPRLRTAIRARDRGERRILLRGWPLLLPGALAYAAGALSRPTAEGSGDSAAPVYAGSEAAVGAPSPSLSRTTAGEASGRPASSA